MWLHTLVDGEVLTVNVGSPCRTWGTGQGTPSSAGSLCTGPDARRWLLSVSRSVHRSVWHNSSHTLSASVVGPTLGENSQPPAAVWRRETRSGCRRGQRRTKCKTSIEIKSRHHHKCTHINPRTAYWKTHTQSVPTLFLQFVRNNTSPVTSSLNKH